MAEKRDQGKKWVYPTLSLLLHLVLISILSQRSWTDLGAPKVLSSLPVQVRWATWAPPESPQPQSRARENIGAMTVREREGRRAGVKESSNFKVLDEAAVEAVHKWLFSPAKRGGTPVTSWVVIPIRFQLIEG